VASPFDAALITPAVLAFLETSTLRIATPMMATTIEVML
jgi:hypothetical protein